MAASVGLAQRLIYYAAPARHWALCFARGEGWGRTHKLITRPTAKFILPARRNAGKNRAPTPPPPAHPSCGMWKMHLKRRTGPGPKDLGICTSIYRLAPSKWSSTRNCSSKNNDCLMSCPLSIIIEWKLAKYAKCCLLLRASSSGRRRGGRRRGADQDPPQVSCSRSADHVMRRPSSVAGACRPFRPAAASAGLRFQRVAVKRVRSPTPSPPSSSLSLSFLSLYEVINTVSFWA